MPSLAVFGPGALYLTRNDVSTVQTPYNIGFCNEFSYDESGEVKELYGQKQYPLDVARGTIKSTGKMKAAKVSGLALNTAFYGLTMVPGFVTITTTPELITVPAASPFTAVVANGAKFNTDLGVVYATSGNPLQRVSAVSAAGQYAVDPTTGTYTFHTSDEGIVLRVVYAYAGSATDGQTLHVTNQLIGTSPTFQLDYVTTNKGQTVTYRFYKCMSSKLSHAHKLTDYDMPEIDFSFYANDADQVYDAFYSSVG